jgi:hypothetical protein
MRAMALFVFAMLAAAPPPAAMESLVAPPPMSVAQATVVIQGVGMTPATLTATDLAKMPRLTVEVEEHGAHVQYSGVPLFALLGRAGAPFGDSLRGDKMTLYVIVGAADNYRAVFALSELDTAFSHFNVLLADQKDGKPLDAHLGPFRIIASGDKREARWVRQVTSLTVAKAP